MSPPLVGGLGALSTGVGLTSFTALLTAVAGAFVAYQGYRGYRRNDSRPMLFLAVGILLLTTVPFLISAVVAFAGAGGPASSELAARVTSVVGLLAVLYSFTGA